MVLLATELRMKELGYRVSVACGISIMIDDHYGLSVAEATAWYQDAGAT